MTTKKNARYGAMSVGGCWELFVVFDKTKGPMVSAHWMGNWVARFSDSSEGYSRAIQKAGGLNSEK